MRIAAIGATVLFALAGCSTTDSSESPFLQPNGLMTGEIDRRMEQIPYQHRDELLHNLLWLEQTGEQTIPALLKGLQHENAKVRSSSAWVLGRLRDHRTVPQLQAAMRDSDQTVRMEVARSLVLMGDLTWCPNLIEGLDSDKKEVRYMCHEALKTASGHDFGYDHLNQDQGDLRLSVLRWRQWWSEYSGDTFFAQSYQRQHNLTPALAAPMGETQSMQPNMQPAQPDVQPMQPAQPMQPDVQPMQPVQPNVQPMQPNEQPNDQPSSDTPVSELPVSQPPASTSETRTQPAPTPVDGSEPLPHPNQQR